MDWTFIYLMVVLKVPIAGLLYIVWWAIHQTDEEPPVDGGDGGTKRPVQPRRPQPPAPRRGPHGDPRPAAPPRTRTGAAHRRAPTRDGD